MLFFILVDINGAFLRKILHDSALNMQGQDYLQENIHTVHTFIYPHIILIFSRNTIVIQQLNPSCCAILINEFRIYADQSYEEV